jgi:hypothetical protein
MRMGADAAGAIAAGSIVAGAFVAAGFVVGALVTGTLTGPLGDADVLAAPGALAADLVCWDFNAEGGDALWLLFDNNVHDKLGRL